MLSKFMDQLTLEQGGRRLKEVCGPITWEPDEVSADFRFIVRQNGVLVTGSASAQAPGDDEWEEKHVTVPGSRTLAAGPAVGTVIAVVHRQGGGAVPLNWTQDVTLVTS